MRTLTPDEARAFYDRFGSKQDSQSFYEARALAQLVANGAFGKARSVFEFGCGTGRFALDLLEHHLSPNCVYRGIDVSTTMVELARSRLAPFAPRAVVTLASAEAGFPLEDSSVDRMISTYVLDLLPDAAIRRAVAEARRVLRPDGLLCLVSITHGSTLPSRVVMGAWQRLFARHPSWVGGCRPMLLAEHLSRKDWVIRFHATVVAWGVASEVLVASPPERAGGTLHSFIDPTEVAPRI